MRFRLLTVAAIGAVAALLLYPTQASTGTIERISENSSGQASASWPNAISADGRHVAFTTVSAYFAPWDTNDKYDVYVRDRQTGETEIVSISTAGEPGNDGSGWPGNLAISAGGRFVAFDSYASNLVAGDTNNVADIFVRDRQVGYTERINVTNGGGQAGMFTESRLGGISADGQFIVFETTANLDPNDQNGLTDVYVRDRFNGTTQRVSGDPARPQAYGNSYEGNISADGRFVTFYDAYWYAEEDTNLKWDIYAYDRQTDELALISANLSGTGSNGDSQYRTSLSADGRFVAFRSAASDLVPGDTNGVADVFVRDRDTDADGVFDEQGAVLTTMVSVDSNGVQGNGLSRNPSISDDGRYVTFFSYASNLVPGDTNGFADVFLHDTVTGETTRLSVTVTGEEAANQSLYPDISADATVISFFSNADLMGCCVGGSIYAHSFSGPGAPPAPPGGSPTPGVTPTPTVTPVPTPTPIPPGPQVNLAIDTIPGGNTATSVGSIEECRSVALGEALDVDIVTTGAPQLAGVSTNLLFDPAVVNVTGVEWDLMLTSQQPAEPLPLLFPLPDSDGDYMVGIIDESDNAESGDGVILRITLKAIGTGLSAVDLNDTSGADNDGVPDVLGWEQGLQIPYQNVVAVDGLIAVDEVCPGAPMSTPTPTATPTPTPTPTPVPTSTPTPPIDPDLDSDGYNDGVEPVIGTNPLAGCGSYDLSHPNPNADIKPSLNWPSDFSKAQGVLDSYNKVNVLDLTTFLAPVRYLGTNVGDNPGDARWDLVPGAGIFSTEINVNDLVSLIAGPSAYPPMFGGAKAFNGPECTP